MPFLTEELWQRLPRRPEDTTPSIVVAKYPQHDPTLEDSEAEASYELLLGCSKGIRSLMAEYAIKEDGKGALHCSHLPFSFDVIKRRLRAPYFANQYTNKFLHSHRSTRPRSL